MLVLCIKLFVDCQICYLFPKFLNSYAVHNHFRSFSHVHFFRSSWQNSVLYRRQGYMEYLRLLLYEIVVGFEFQSSSKCWKCIIFLILRQLLGCDWKYLELQKSDLLCLLQSDVNTVCFADETGHLIFSGSDDSLCKVTSSIHSGFVLLEEKN